MFGKYFESKIYLNILNQNQTDYYLVGGSAITLLLGYREYSDFDLFTKKNKNQLKTKSTFF